MLEQIRKDGYVRVKVDGTIYPIDEVPPLDKKYKHTIDVVVDRLKVRQGIRGRLSESLETAFAFGKGLCKVDVEGKETVFSQNYACPDCGISVEELTPEQRVEEIARLIGADEQHHESGLLHARNMLSAAWERKHKS